MNMKLYLIRLIHCKNDWDAEFKFKATGKKTAIDWAKRKLSDPNNWLVTSCTVVEADEVAKEPTLVELWQKLTPKERADATREIAAGMTEIN